MKWSIAEAWKASNGRVDVDPIKPEEVECDHITELDRLIGESVGVGDEAGLKRIHAAVAYGLPWLTTNTLPPARTNKSALRHAADFAIECVEAYCKQDGITGYRSVIKALKSLDLSRLCGGDWFLIWDAMGCSGRIEDQQQYDFYKHAGRCHRYAAAADRETNEKGVKA